MVYFHSPASWLGKQDVVEFSQGQSNNGLAANGLHADSARFDITSCSKVQLIFYSSAASHSRD
jgi:hypothetical protein